MFQALSPVQTHDAVMNQSTITRATWNSNHRISPGHRPADTGNLQNQDVALTSTHVKIADAPAVTSDMKQRCMLLEVVLQVRYVYSSNAAYTCNNTCIRTCIR